MEGTAVSQIRPAPEEQGIQGRIGELVAPLVVEREQLVAEREQARARVAMISADIEAVERVLKAAGHEVGTSRKPKRTPTRTLSEGVAEAVRAVQEAPEPLASSDLCEALGISLKAAQRRLTLGRDLGLLRQAGNRPSEGGKDFKLYAALPDATERMATLTAAT